MVTAELLRQLMPYATGRVDLFAAPLLAAMDEFGIMTARRQAAFLAQVAHESGELRYVLELADGEAYENREDLGNTEPGDGPRFKGRGLLQITGRSNYAICGGALKLDLLNSPSLLEVPEGASRSAGWLWMSRGLSGLADVDRFETITKLINGGFNGLAARTAYWCRARSLLAVA
jgi:putative chitinase